MKSKFIKSFSALLVVSSIFLFSQPAKAQFYYGGTAGYLNSTAFGTDAFGGMNYMPGMSVGMNMGFKIVTDLNFQWEVLYSTKGFNQKFIIKDLVNAYENDTTEILRTITKQHTNQLKLSYVEVPIYLKKSFSFKGGIFPYDRKVSKTDFDLFIGAYVGYLMSANSTLKATRQVTKTSKTTTTTGETTDTASSFMIGQAKTVEMLTADDSASQSTLLALLPSSTPSLSGGLNSIDVGIVLGAGFSVELSPTTKFYINARYSMGVLSIDKTYFNNTANFFIPNNAGEYTINGSNYSLTSTSTKIDLRNKGVGVYIGFIHYIGMNI